MPALLEKRAAPGNETIICICVGVGLVVALAICTLCRQINRMVCPDLHMLPPSLSILPGFLLTLASGHTSPACSSPDRWHRMFVHNLPFLTLPCLTLPYICKFTLPRVVPSSKPPWQHFFRNLTVARPPWSMFSASS